MLERMLRGIPNRLDLAQQFMEQALGSFRPAGLSRMEEKPLAASEGALAAPHSFQKWLLGLTRLAVQRQQALLELPASAHQKLGGEHDRVSRWGEGIWQRTPDALATGGISSDPTREESLCDFPRG